MKMLFKTITVISAIALASCGYSVGYFIPGDDGKNCSVTRETTTEVEITCENGYPFIISKASQGDNGNAGKDGESCLVTGETSTEVEITCENNSVKVPKGIKGDNGESGKDGTGCSITKEIDAGIEITCGNDFVRIPKASQGDNGKDGKDGTKCNVEEDGAYFVMTCRDGSEAMWAKAMCGVNAYDPAYKFCDFRDGSVYKYVTIGSQVWMAENLNYKTTSGSWCYGDDTDNCKIYGRLYDWATAMNLPSSCDSSICSSQIEPLHQGLCPSGWHISTNEEWDALVDYVENEQGCNNCAGNYLKATSGWNNNGNDTDIYGFSALPGGSRDSSGYFLFLGNTGSWWGAVEYDRNSSYYNLMNYNSGFIIFNNYYKNFGLSIRCIKD